MKFRYLIIDDFNNVTGTNELNVARAAFFEGDSTVIDARDGRTFEEPFDGGADDLRFDAIENHAEAAEASPPNYGGTDDGED